MNNFSPSTDTSVGTKRFTAQEVQLAYTLMAVEYMKTIKGLNPNHQLVDKAVKLKALGFTNSKEVGDAITSEEDLKVLKCYSFLQRHFPGSLILKEEDFINLNVKYGLVVGRLSAYKGSVPDENIDEISKVMATAQALEANEYVNYSGNGSPLRYVTGMQVATHPMPIDKMSYPVGRYFIRQELGLMDSLPRRHAALEDITVNNVIFANRDAKKVMAGNIFEELAADTKVNPKKFDKLTEISIDDFIANVVPTATNIEVLMESRLSNNLVTLTAPVNKDAKNLFKWPNNFAWTYNGGVADSIKEKVRAAGGQTEGFLRCSLAWSNYDDLDLHVVEPNNLEIYYSNRIGRSGGKLDVDENAGYGKTRKPVENIIWVNERKMLEGKYVVYVNNFHCRESVDTGFTLEIEHNGEVRQFVYDKPVKHKENVMVAEITYSKSKDIQIRELIPSTSNSSVSLWNIDTNKFHKVNVMSPNYWDEQGIGNKHYFFMLDDCKNPEPVRGFFNEYLNSELTPHRKVFEVLADKMKTPYQEHQLSGLGFSSTMRNSVIVKVDGTFSRTLKVNF